MNPVAGVFLSLGQLGQSSHKFERTLYMPLQCPTYHGDPPLVQGHAARTLSQLDLKVGYTKHPRQTWQGAAWSDGRLHPSDRANATTQAWRVSNVQFEPGQNALSTLLIEQKLLSHFGYRTRSQKQWVGSYHQ